jgi:hypothetical protein
MVGPSQEEVQWVKSFISIKWKVKPAGWEGKVKHLTSQVLSHEGADVPTLQEKNGRMYILPELQQE